MGDLIVSPLILQWREWKFGRIRMQQRLDFDFFLPAEQYQRTSAVNLSSHAFEANPYYAVTVFPAKHLETSWRVHYLWNAVNHAKACPLKFILELVFLDATCWRCDPNS